MKKHLFSIMLFVCMPLAIQAQFQVNANGYSTTNNITVEGDLGTGKSGTIMVTANQYDPNFNPHYGPGSIICTQSKVNAAYAYTFYDSSDNLKFSVSDRGVIFAAGTSTLSDSTCKTDMVRLQSSLAKIKRLHGISYRFKDEATSQSLPPNTVQGATTEISRKMTEERNCKRIGLVAQEVETVFPEVVRTQFDGTKAIFYDDLVAVLVDAVNEMHDSLTAQASQVNEMRQRLDALEATWYGTSKTQHSLPQTPQKQPHNGMRTQKAYLKQNTPNPFNRSTTISYQLSSDPITASICIYNLNGTQLKQFPLDETIREGQITISASTLVPGIYIYALIIDGQMEDSKRMILTE